MRDLNLFLAVLCGVLTITAVVVFAARILRGAFPPPCPSCKRRGLMRVGKVGPSAPTQYACPSCRACFHGPPEERRWSRIDGPACEVLLKELDERA